MATRFFFSLLEKKQALVLFQAGHGPLFVSKQLNISFSVVRSWYKLFKSGQTDWAMEDEETFVNRKKALKLFQQGLGCKRVATNLGLPISRVKYWLLHYRAGNTEFFTKGRIGPSRYDKAFKAMVVDEFLAGNISQKVFCARVGISTATLRNWLREKDKSQYLLS